jgi:hypothetical protein
MIAPQAAHAGVWLTLCKLLDEIMAIAVSLAVAPMAVWHSSLTLSEAAQKWRLLAERRRAHFVELYHTGRWKRYYSEEQFLLKIREAVKACDRWAEIAPTPPRVAASHGCDTRTRSAA